MVAGFDPNLILALNLAGTFAFGSPAAWRRSGRGSTCSASW
jgi:hypothetical protein